jgi:hypothetical protein
MKTLYKNNAEPGALVPIVNIGEVGAVRALVLITSLVREGARDGQDKEEEVRRCLLTAPISTGLIVGAETRFEELWAKDLSSRLEIAASDVLHSLP